LDLLRNWFSSLLRGIFGRESSDVQELQKQNLTHLTMRKFVPMGLLVYREREYQGRSLAPKNGFESSVYKHCFPKGSTLMNFGSLRSLQAFCYNSILNTHIFHSFTRISGYKLDRSIRKPRPQGLLLVQNGGRRYPWPRLPKWLQRFVTILSRKHDEMSSLRLNNGFRLQKTNRAARRWKQPPKKSFHRVLCDKILHYSWSISAPLARGFSDRHFERGEGPGDEVGRSDSPTFYKHPEKI